MTTRDEQRASRFLEQLRDFLASDLRILPGSIVTREMRCGKATCPRHDEPPQLHGPYLQWSYTVANKRFTRWLTPKQQERIRPRIEANKRLRELIGELERLEIFSAERAEGWGT